MELPEQSSQPRLNGRENDSEARPSLFTRMRGKVAFFSSVGPRLLSRALNPPPKRSCSKCRKEKIGLPLPLPTHWHDRSIIPAETSRVLNLMEDIMEHILSTLYLIQKSLTFWKSRVEGTSLQKVYFMVFERGPHAFLDGLSQLLYDLVTEGHSTKHLCHLATTRISANIAILTSLQRCLASFLAQLYMEIDKLGGDLVNSTDNSFLALFAMIDRIFSDLETSICWQKLNLQSGCSHPVNGNNHFWPKFSKLCDITQNENQSVAFDINNVIDLVYQNLHILDSFLATLISEHKKPGRVTLYWFHYTCGAVGLSLCSVWLFRHSSLMGCSDLHNWILEGKGSVVGFWDDHVHQPLVSIRDELFETFKSRDKGVMQMEEVQLTAKSLHMMLLAFSEQMKGKKFPDDASDQEMLEMVMTRYEKELTHPIQNILGGELVRCLLIQIQKLKLDIETAMLELDQILKANEINFAILAALPAFFLSLLLILLVRAWATKDRGAEGKGRIARLQRRLLVVEVEKRLTQFQQFKDDGLDDEAYCMFGLLLYSLHRLYKAVERHALQTAEWSSLREDILDAARPSVSMSYKLSILSRMEHVYDCLLPSTRRR